MKNIFIIIAVTLIGLNASHAKIIEIMDTGITFDAPDDFVEVPKRIKDLKWNSLNAPKFAIGNDAASTTIAYDIKPNNISNAPLGRVQQALGDSLERIIPGLEWHKREIIQLSGKEWIYFELSSNAVDTNIYNIMLVTSYGREMLMFNFNSTKEDFPIYEAALRKSMETITLPN